MEHLDAKLSIKIVACVDGGVKCEDFGQRDPPALCEKAARNGEPRVSITDLNEDGALEHLSGQNARSYLLVNRRGFECAHVFFHDFEITIEFDIG
jgi:hypothetical protein